VGGPEPCGSKPHAARVPYGTPSRNAGAGFRLADPPRGFRPTSDVDWHCGTTGRGVAVRSGRPLERGSGPAGGRGVAGRDPACTPPEQAVGKERYGQLGLMGTAGRMLADCRVAESVGATAEMRLAENTPSGLEDAPTTSAGSTMSWNRWPCGWLGHSRIASRGWRLAGPNSSGGWSIPITASVVRCSRRPSGAAA